MLKNDKLILLVDQSGKILTMDRAAQKFWGEMRGESFLSRIVKNDSQIAQGFQNVIRTGEPWEGVFSPTEEEGVVISFTRQDKERVCIEIQSKNVVRSAAVMPQYSDPLSPVVKERLKFLLRASHNLRTPLAVIQGGLELIEGDPEVSGENKKLIEDLLLETSYFRKMLEKILWLTRIDLGTPFALDTIDLERFVNDITVNFARSHAQEVILCKDQKDFREVLAEKNALSEVLNNLLENAHDFCPEGRIGVHLVADEEKKIMRVIVCDEGPGISEEESHKIFERFYSQKGENDKRGTGLGLALVKELVEMMGGEVGVNAKKDGAEVWFTLKLS